MIIGGGLLLYAAVRVAVDSFFNRLGATPDEVGLSYAVTLSRAAVGLVGYLLLIGLVVALAYMGIVVSRGHKTASAVVFVVIGIAGFVASGATVAFALGVVTSGRYPAWVPAVASSFLIAVGVLTLVLAGSKGRAVGLAVTLLALSMVGFNAQARGQALADRVIAGVEVRPNPLLTIVPVTATCMRIRWTDTDAVPPFDPERPVLYLGASEGIVLLLETPTRTRGATLHRLPESSLTMQHEVTAEPQVCE